MRRSTEEIGREFADRKPINWSESGKVIPENALGLAAKRLGLIEVENAEGSTHIARRSEKQLGSMIMYGYVFHEMRDVEGLEEGDRYFASTDSISEEA